MNSDQLSPSIRAALQANPNLAKRALAGNDLPIAIEGSGAIANPAVPMTRRELLDHLAARNADIATMEAFGFTKQAMDVARARNMHEAAIDVAGSIEGALVRVASLDERAARYRAGTGGKHHLSEPGVPLPCKVEPSFKAEVEALARQRGETTSETARFLMKSGMILADERRARYEAYMIKQIETGAIEIERAIDTSSPSMQRAQQLANPFSGGPEEVKAVVEKAKPVGYF